MALAEELLTPQEARRLFTYDPETGVIRRVFGGHGLFAGDEVGRTISGGYRMTKFKDRRLLVHRLAWAIANGRWPRQLIDHVNGDRADNRLCNLREADPVENKRNMKRPVTNTSGHKGVTWCKARGKWNASIRFAGKSKNLGRFDNLEDAAAAYRAGALKYHGDFARFE